MRQPNYATFKSLLAAGINEAQAEAITKSITTLSKQISSNYSWHDEIKKLSDQVELMLREMEKLELRMTIKMGSISAVASSLLFSALKLWGD